MEQYKDKDLLDKSPPDSFDVEEGPTYKKWVQSKNYQRNPNKNVSASLYNQIEEMKALIRTQGLALAELNKKYNNLQNDFVELTELKNTQITKIVNELEDILQRNK